MPDSIPAEVGICHRHPTDKICQQRWQSLSFLPLPRPPILSVLKKIPFSTITYPFTTFSWRPWH